MSNLLIASAKKLYHFSILALFICLLGACATTDTTNKEGTWVATWGASPFTFQSFGNAAAPGPFKNQTLRQVLRVSVGGDQVQIRFSNEAGNAPITIGAASVAVLSSKSDVKADTIRSLTFGGNSSITIPAGAPALSDPVNLSIDSLTEIAISIYLPEETPASTVHMGRISYISGTGDFTKLTNIPNAEANTNHFFLSGVYVTRSQNTKVVAALGDSITDGAASTPFTYNSWPDHFAQRLHDNNVDNISVVNHGISGNQVLRDGMGISALARFDRDVLSIPGLTHIILLEGINDIGTGGMVFPGAQGPAPALRTADEIIAGYQQLINRAHSQNPSIKIYGATLLPFEGTFAGYYSPEKDVVRHQVNDWIRNSGAFDAVVDFDKAVQDPANPNKIKAEYDSGDKLHPGDVGYKKMADSIDLNLFK